jgi:glycerophosphoryl diester phosphodiesterase
VHTYAELLDSCPTLVTLEEVLERFAARAFLYIELKTRGMTGRVLSALKAHRPKCGYLVASFLPEVLESLHARDSALPLGLICDKRSAFLRWRSLPVCAVMTHRRLTTPEVIDELHAAGKQVYVWTVNTSKDMESYARMGADAILSDDTELLVRTVRGV